MIGVILLSLLVAGQDPVEKPNPARPGAANQKPAAQKSVQSPRYP